MHADFTTYMYIHVLSPCFKEEFYFSIIIHVYNSWLGMYPSFSILSTMLPGIVWLIGVYIFTILPSTSPTEAMFAPCARELGRLVFKYGGEPVASFLPPPSNHVLKPTTTNAMFMDATHDNDPGHILVSGRVCV